MPDGGHLSSRRSHERYRHIHCPHFSRYVCLEENERDCLMLLRAEENMVHPGYPTIAPSALPPLPSPALTGHCPRYSVWTISSQKAHALCRVASARCRSCDSAGQSVQRMSTVLSPWPWSRQISHLSSPTNMLTGIFPRVRFGFTEPGPRIGRS